MTDLHVTVLPPPTLRATLAVGQGPAGPMGATGVRGPTGPIGATGPYGATGLVGATGPQGPTGSVGATGPRGATGVQGPTGLMGATGPVGATGMFSAQQTATLDQLRSMSWNVANAAALTALDATTFLDGAHVWVETVRDFFVLRTSAAALVAAKVVASSAAGRRWFRVNIPDPSWALQATWEINTATGNDEADGSTVGTAIKTWDELVRRVGLVAGFYANQFMTVNLAGDLPASDPIRGRLNVGPLGGFHVKGRLGSPVFTGTVSAKDDLSTATTNGTCNAVTSTWTPASWISTDNDAYIVKDATNNLWAWVAKDLGGGKAKLSPWCAIGNETGGQSNDFAAASTTFGATIEVYRLPRALGRLQWFNEAGQRGFFANVFSFINWDTNNATISRAVSVGSSIYFQQCRLRVMYGGGFITFANSLLADMGWGSEAPVYGNIRAGLVLNVPAVNGNVFAYSTWDITSNVLFQNSAIGFTRGAHVRMRNAFFEDCTAPCIVIQGGGVVQLNTSTICGNGNTAALITCQGQGSKFMLYAGTMASQMKAATTSLTPILFNAASTAPAFDPATSTFTAYRALTVANIDATVAAAGFGGQVNDPVTGCFVGKAF